jgi:hypothetical protein
MLDKIKSFLSTELHAAVTAVKHWYLVAIAFLVTLGPQVPDMLDQVKALDYANMSVKALVTSTALIVGRVILLKLLALI